MKKAWVIGAAVLVGMAVLLIWWVSQELFGLQQGGWWR